MFSFSLIVLVTASSIFSLFILTLYPKTADMIDDIIKSTNAKNDAITVTTIITEM